MSGPTGGMLDPAPIRGSPTIEILNP